MGEAVGGQERRMLKEEAGDLQAKAKRFSFPGRLGKAREAEGSVPGLRAEVGTIRQLSPQPSCLLCISGQF